MDRRIKDEALSREILGIAADLEMLFTYGDALAVLCKEGSAGKAADAGPDDYGVEII
jgi:hypothetical protein